MAHWPRTPRDPGWAPLRRHHPGRRRLVAAGLAAGSVAAALQVLAPRPDPGRPIVVAARDVAAGAVLGEGDVLLVRRPDAARPAGVVTDPESALGRTVASGVRSGEALTDTRLVGPGMLSAGPPGLVGAPVRIADGAAAALVRAGDRVDVLQASVSEGGAGAFSPGSPTASPNRPDGAEADAGQRAPAAVGLPRARTVVRRVTVLARPTAPGDDSLLADSDPSGGGLLVLAVDEQQAAALAEAAALGPLSVVLR